MGAQGDYLSSFWQGDIGWSVMLFGMLAAFAFGAVHALGRPLARRWSRPIWSAARHASSRHFPRAHGDLHPHGQRLRARPGDLDLSRFVLPETITPILGAISGITIVWVGATLLYRRTIGRVQARSAGLVHHHGDGRVHTHVPDEMSVGGLIALGASGGLVPCPFALVRRAPPSRWVASPLD